MWYVWLIAAGVFLAIEISTVTFLTFWFALGSILAMIVSFITDNIVIQSVVFIVSSSILIIFTRPLVDKYINKPTKPTNTSLLISKHGTVIIDINSVEGTGQVKVNGEVWSAKGEEDVSIPKGTDIEVLKVDGVKLVVAPLKIHSPK